MLGKKDYDLYTTLLHTCSVVLSPASFQSEKFICAMKSSSFRNTERNYVQQLTCTLYNPEPRFPNLEPSLSQGAQGGWSTPY